MRLPIDPDVEATATEIDEAVDGIIEGLEFKWNDAPTCYAFFEDAEGLVWVMLYKEHEGNRHLIDTQLMPLDFVYQHPALH